MRPSVKGGFFRSMTRLLSYRSKVIKLFNTIITVKILIFSLESIEITTKTDKMVKVHKYRK